MSQIRVWFSVIVMIVTSGCGRATQPPTAQQSEQARELLVTVLDAWKQGKIPELSDRKPPIRFADDDVVEGWQLISYSLEESSTPTTAVNDVRVILDLRNSQGQATSKVATYQVSLAPNLAVMRADY